MSSTGPIVTLSPRDYDAVLFDMDGVLTQTASLHAVAWKQLFDAFLERRSAASGQPFIAFDIDTDYRQHVDGKPRYDGVAAFLQSRAIDLPWGTEEDGPEVQSVHGLGSRKDQYFMEELQRHGVQPFEAAVDLVRALRAQGVRTAVVTSSVNCEAVLQEARIADLFDARVDGVDITRLGLHGKPAPDSFLEVLQILSDIRRSELLERLAIPAAEIERWQDISRRMFVPFHENGIISQFEGYEALREFDWEGYRLRYGNIGRLDLILEAENDSMNRYKLGKQADVLMLFYVFSAEELAELFERLGYPLDPQAIPRNVAYYDSRSSHGSTLSRVVHAWVMARSDRPRSLQYYAEALQSDVSDIQQGTTAEGVHLGAMAGTVDLIMRVSTGIEATGDVLRLNPQLPPEIRRLDMRIRYRGHSLDLRLTRDRLRIHGRERGIAPIKLGVRGEIVEFACGSTREFSLA